jgi:hypothetical protein
LSISRVDAPTITNKIRNLNVTRMAALQLRQALEIPDARRGTPYDYQSHIKAVVGYLNEHLGITWNTIRQRTSKMDFAGNFLGPELRCSSRISSARDSLETYVNEHSHLFDCNDDWFDNNDWEDFDVLIEDQEDD